MVNKFVRILTVGSIEGYLRADVGIVRPYVNRFHLGRLTRSFVTLVHTDVSRSPALPFMDSYRSYSTVQTSSIKTCNFKDVLPGKDVYHGNLGFLPDIVCLTFQRKKDYSRISR